MAKPFGHDGLLARERAARQRTLIADVLESLRVHPLEPAAPDETGGAAAAPAGEYTRLEDLIAAAVTELARHERHGRHSGHGSLGAGVLASLMARHRARPRIDRV